MEARQAESSHTQLLFPAPSPRGPPGPPITGLGAGKRAIQFLKAAVSISREAQPERVQHEQHIFTNGGQ